ncbi:hypothetical protein G6F41_013277 [Rhizopus arrhizus]|nr:hypothetical protein G6F41_013277 [Rhizopus arrhizus]
MQFLYEDGQGHIDEHGVEFVDLAVDEELFAIETISSRTQFYRTNIQKDLILKYLNASAAARQLGIHVRAPQIWVKHYYEDPESIFEIKQKTGQHCILGEEHKQFFLKLH